MGIPPIRLLVAEDDQRLSQILCRYFEKAPEIALCGVARDGGEILRRVVLDQPDLVVLDLILPVLDGLSVLEQLNRLSGPRPGVIVTAPSVQDRYLQAALDLGADYCIRKPYSLPQLRRRIQLAADPHPAGLRQTAGAQDIGQAVLALGIPTHLLAYRYAVSAVTLLLQDAAPHAIVKEVYTAVAGQFDTTPSCVEGAIRKGVRQVWEHNGAPLRALMQAQAGMPPPSNSRFLTTLTERLRLQAG